MGTSFYLAARSRTFGLVLRRWKMACAECWPMGFCRTFASVHIQVPCAAVIEEAAGTDGLHGDDSLTNGTISQFLCIEAQTGWRFDALNALATEEPIGRFRKLLKMHDRHPS